MNLESFTAVLYFLGILSFPFSTALGLSFMAAALVQSIICSDWMRSLFTNNKQKQSSRRADKKHRTWGTYAAQTHSAWVNFDRKQHIFLVCAFSMIAKLSKADGIVSKEEIELVERFISNELELRSEQIRFVIQIFRAAKSDPRSFAFFAEQFYAQFRKQPALLHSMIDILLQLASSDKLISHTEEQLIRSAAALFGISRTRYKNLRALYSIRAQSHAYAQEWSRNQSEYSQKRANQQHSTWKRPISSLPQQDLSYSVLGCSIHDSDRQIKKRYRQLVHEYHPDKAIAQGLPEMFVDRAHRKFREIQQAYETVCEERGIT